MVACECATLNLARHDGQTIQGIHFAWGQHNISSPIVTISSDGRHADATFYLVCLLTMAASPAKPEAEAYVLAGKYSDKLVKIGEQWFFEEITGTIEQSSPWTEGLVKSPFVKESW